MHSTVCDGEPDETEDEDDDEYAQLFTPIPDSVRIDVNKQLADANIDVYSYTKNCEVTVLAQEILSRTERGLLFRVYVPNAQLWSNETDRLLQLFRDYLVRVAHADVGSIKYARKSA